MSDKLPIKEIRKIVKKIKNTEHKRLTDENTKINKYILEYIKKNNLIVTGQLALKALLPDTIQLDPQRNMFEVVTSSPVQHQNKLLAELSETFKHVSRTMHGNGHFAVQVKHRIIIIFMYVKPRLFETIDTRTIDNIKYESEIMHKIRIYAGLTNPTEYISQWKDLFRVNLKLNQKYKLESGTKLCFIQKERSPKEHLSEYEKVKDLLDKKFVKGNKNVIVVGVKGYQLMVHVSKVKKVYYPKVIRYTELLSIDVKRDIEQIKKIVNSDKINIKKSGSTLDYHGPKWSVYFQKQKVLDIYDAGKECVPFGEIDGYTVGSFFLIMKYLYIGVWVAKKMINSKMLEQKNLCLINNLIKAREYYLSSNGQIGVEPGPFKIFHTLCIGTRQDIRLSQVLPRWDRWEKRFSKNKIKD